MGGLRELLAMLTSLPMRNVQEARDSQLPSQAPGWSSGGTACSIVQHAVTTGSAPVLPDAVQ